jgi:Domain of unknown function (DUF1844)
MSEEQTGFKVTDRRLFNADGTPRDVEREETPDEAAATTTTAAAPTTTARGASTTSAREADAPPESAAAQSSPRRPQRATAERAGEGSAAAARAPQEEAYEDSYDESAIPGVDDPASFLNFLMSIASNAAASLGMMEHPVTGQRGVDLPLAKHWIDVLGMLEEKTRGNLSPQERQIFEGLLSDLRLQYVNLTNAASPAQKRGFTGRDIIGGK